MNLARSETPEEVTGLTNIGGTRRFLVLSLPLWATDCLVRHDREIRDPATPLALYEKAKGAMRLVACNDPARKGKLHIGQSVSDARAQLPGLVLREIDREWLAAVFADFADWHSWASPIVAVLPGPEPYGELALDITGVSHLFGGEDRLLATATSRLRALGFTVTGAIADTLGAAWALARHAPSTVAGPDLAAILADLPVAALRLTPDQAADLARMGLKRIGDLYNRPRKPLQARFGKSLLVRLDQALGRLEERLVPRVPEVAHFAERRFAEPLGLLDDVLAGAADLAHRLAADLETAGLGARTFHLFLYRVDHRLMTLTVHSGPLTREPAHIARLFAHRAERLGAEYDPGFGIDQIRLAADQTGPLDARQTSALETRDGAENIERLTARMAARLGNHAVLRARPVNTHIPERAVRFETAIAPTPPAPAPPPLRAARPIRLLPVPEPISVLAEVPDGPPSFMVWRRVRYGFVRASGPERIGAEWWRSGRRLDIAPQAEATPPEPGRTQAPPFVSTLAVFSPEASTRDYYIAEDEGGRRFWLFRLGLYERSDIRPDWYLHGFFS